MKTFLNFNNFFYGALDHYFLAMCYVTFRVIIFNFQIQGSFIFHQQSEQIQIPRYTKVAIACYPFQRERLARLSLGSVCYL